LRTLRHLGPLAWLNAGKDDTGPAWILTLSDFSQMKNLLAAPNNCSQVTSQVSSLPELTSASRAPRPPSRPHFTCEAVHLTTDVTAGAGSPDTLRASPPALLAQPAPAAHKRSCRPNAGRTGYGACNPPLEAGVVVLVPVLVGGTCVELRHSTFPLSGSHSYRSVPVRSC